jgi:phosphatidylinositol alpha-1,6-mannosyltransferase
LWPKWLPAIKILKSAVERQGIEHIIVGHILPLGIVTYRFHKLTGIPYTVILHGMDLTLAMKFGRKQLITKQILNNAKNIICASANTSEILAGFMGKSIKEKVQIVHPGIASNFIVDKIKLENIKKQYNLFNKTVLFSIGRLVKRKGVNDVITAMEEVNKSYPDLHYFIAGDGPEKMKLLDSAMQNKNITFLGRISDKEKNAWLSACDMFVQPAYATDDDFEGFGIVYLEASIASKAVIAGNSGGVPEAVEDGVSGILVEPKNIPDIVQAITRLASDSGLRQKLGRQGHDRALEWFNWERQIGRFYKIVNN